MIKSVRHRGIERFFKLGSKAGIQPSHAEKLRIRLFALDNASRPQDMNSPGWQLYPLHGDLAGHWSVDVSGNWRLTFAFEGEDAVLVDYQDYHQSYYANVRSTAPGNCIEGLFGQHICYCCRQASGYHASRPVQDT